MDSHFQSFYANYILINLISRLTIGVSYADIRKKLINVQYYSEDGAHF